MLNSLEDKRGLTCLQLEMANMRVFWAHRMLLMTGE